MSVMLLLLNVVWINIAGVGVAVLVALWLEDRNKSRLLSYSCGAASGLFVYSVLFWTVASLL